MKRNLFLQLIICAVLLCGISPLSAAPVPPAEAKNWVETRGNELLQAFGEPDLAVKYRRLDELLLKYVDLDYISRFVIGKHWRQMTAEQKEQYRALFRRYALALYKGFPLNFGEQLNFKVGQITPAPEHTVVQILINLPGSSPQQNGSEIAVEFLISRNKKQTRIIDLKLGESSLILSYRSRFYEMVAEADDDIGWFLEDLETVTVSSERNNQLKLK